MHAHQQERNARITPVKTFYLPKRTPQDYSRLTFQHHALRMALSGNFLAPCTHPTTVLDVACGTGAWTADMGKLFPSAKITGVDIAKPVCPQSPHFQFIEGRTPSSLPFEDASFDYVHQRCLGTVIPTAHWQGIIHEMVRVIRLGGWIELMEYGPFVNPGPATQQFCLWRQQVLAERGIDPLEIEHLGNLLQHAGLTHVEQKTLPIPLYGGGRATGMMVSNLLAMIRSAKESILALGIEHQAFFSQVVEALPNEWMEYKTVYQFHVAYGQRPNIFFQTSLGQRSHTKTSLIQQR